MRRLKIAAFSDGESGGNPAGVVIADDLPQADAMQKIAAEIGFSETVFAAPVEGGWRVRYFAPQVEVPFCGHATIALGAALAWRNGDAEFNLILNSGQVSVTARKAGPLVEAGLRSLPTSSGPPTDELRSSVMRLFGYDETDLDPRIQPAMAHAGANHFILALNRRSALRRMAYDFAAGRTLMLREGLVTILLAFAETEEIFHTRNAFAYGGVYEDPATGAATAALAGYLRDISWPRASIAVRQGDDMGMPSRLRANFSERAGHPVLVSGTARRLSD